MPIYTYRCSACGHTQDILQKIHEAPLSLCPSCGQSTFTKQVTAAGFQLKGSGWYATDFRSNNKTTTESNPQENKSSKPNDATPNNTSSDTSVSNPTPPITSPLSTS